MRKIIKFFIVFIIVASLAIPNTQVFAASQLQVGDYIEFASYNNEALVWQVIGFDKNGHGILWCTSIVELFAFDGAESGTSGSGNSDSDQYGSNQYYNSNIKEWLNSTSPSVSFTTSKPTTAATVQFQSFDDVSSGAAYDNKAGFLTSFSSLEKSALINKEMMTKLVGSNVTSNYSFSIGTIDDAYSTFNLGNSMMVEGQVFLLSIEEMSKWVNKNQLPSTRTLKNSLENQYYWLRTPDGKNLKTVMTIDYAGNVFKTDANYSNTGVVPAIAINFDLTPILSGLGSISRPYKLDLNATDQLIKTFDSTLKTSIESKVKEFKISLDESSDITIKELIARSIEEELLTSESPNDLKVVYKYYMNQNNVFIHRDLFTTNHLLVNKSASGSKSFSDIGSLTSSEKEAIDILTSYGVIDGYTDGTFKPAKPVSRSEVAKIISIAVALEQQSYSNEFKDISSDKWFANYVASIKDSGIVQGYSDGTFKPYETITYDEMSAIVSRVLKENNSFFPVDMTDKTLNTQSTVSKWASGDVNLLLENQLIEVNKTYNGKTAMTRIDIVVLMDRLIELIYE